MTVKDVKDLFAFDVWATNRTLEAVSALNEEQFKKDLGNSFGSVHGTLVHLFGADRVWLARWKNEQQTPTKADDIPTFADVKERWAKLQSEMNAFVDTLSDERIQKPFDYKDLRGNAHSHPMYQQLQHKVNHSTYHRGQITTLLRQLGAKPIGTDLVAFYREQNARG